ncbi:proline-rich receptor-like protein kinase PERK2 [Penaeus chinensis]|uniref:proline-rich receptor-like protein kinase PERK2 n=1 Tax=Penaeus chinensis TaxID=139456 RepID=UPI001FB5FE4F|nr:proline-rich receptor-like protein kinase PERK2 [Penaeus chinensis]
MRRDLGCSSGQTDRSRTDQPGPGPQTVSLVGLSSPRAPPAFPSTPPSAPAPSPPPVLLPPVRSSPPPPALSPLFPPRLVHPRGHVRPSSTLRTCGAAHTLAAACAGPKSALRPHNPATSRSRSYSSPTHLLRRPHTSTSSSSAALPLRPAKDLDSCQE